MPSKIHIELAFVMVDRGHLLDVGIVRTYRQVWNLCRLHSRALDRSARRQVPEQLGLLLALYYLYGRECLSPGTDEFLIFGEGGPQGRNSSDYPGLVDYVKHFHERKHPRSHSDGSESYTGKRDEQDPHNIGRDLVFTGGELYRVVKRAGPKSGRRGIVATGRLLPDDVWLMELPIQDRNQVYNALRHLDLRALRKCRIQGAKVREYIRTLQVAIARKPPYDPHGHRRENAGASLAPDAYALHERIMELVDSALELPILIRPTDWDARAELWRESIVPQILTHLPASDVGAGTEPAEELLSTALSRVSEGNSDVRLLLAVHLTLHGHHKAALKELNAYSDAHFKDALPHVLAGSILHQSGQHGAAIQSYEEAYRRGERAQAAFGIAFANMLAGDMQEALEWVNRGTEIASTCRSGRVVRAILLRMNGRFEEALDVAEGLLSEDQNDSYAMAQRAWCLFTVRRYREAFDESRRLLDSKKGPYIHGYSIIAACLCQMGKLKFAERLLERIRPIRGKGRDALDVYRRLRFISLRQGERRRAVRYAAQMCRCDPEGFLPKLWLGYDLKNTGHEGLAARFSNTSIVWDRLSAYETAEVARAYLFLEDLYKAASCSSRISDVNLLKVVIDDVSDYQIMQLCLGLSTLLNMRLLGVEPGDWREPCDTFQRLYELLPEKESIASMLYEPFVLLTCLVSRDEFVREWCRRWNIVPHERFAGYVRASGCWRVYARLKRFGGQKDIEECIHKVCAPTFDELVGGTVQTAGDLTIAVLAAGVLTGINRHPEIGRVVEEVCALIKELGSSHMTHGAGCALCILAVELARQGHLDHVLRLALLVRSCVTVVEDRLVKCDLAYVLALGCRSAVMRREVCSNSEKLFHDVSSLLKELDSGDMQVQLWPIKFNYTLAIIHDMCIRRVKDDEIMDRIQAFMNESRNVAVPEKVNRHMECAFLASVICYAFNHYLDAVGKRMLSEWSERFMWDRELSSQILHMRTRIDGVIANRPIEEAGLVPVGDDWGSDIFRGWEEMLCIMAASEAMDEDSRKDLGRDILKVMDSVEFFKIGPTVTSP